MKSLFPDRSSESNLGELDNSSIYAVLLVEGYWGSREGDYKHTQFTSSDFQIGDLFVAKGACNTCEKTRYLVALYQGDGNFLAIANCSSGCAATCAHDTTTIFAEDFFNQTSVATWDYYFVLRPNQLNDPT